MLALRYDIYIYIYMSLGFKGLMYNSGTFLTGLKKARRNLSHTSGLRFKTESPELISKRRKRKVSPFF